MTIKKNFRNHLQLLIGITIKEGVILEDREEGIEEVGIGEINLEEEEEVLHKNLIDVLFKLNLKFKLFYIFLYGERLVQNAINAELCFNKIVIKYIILYIYIYMIIILLFFSTIIQKIHIYIIKYYILLSKYFTSIKRFNKHRFII